METKNMLNEFTDYFNDFYGQNGIYSSGKNYTKLEVSTAIIHLLKTKKGHRFDADSFDRELIRDILITEKVQDLMYK